MVLGITDILSGCNFHLSNRTCLGGGALQKVLLRNIKSRWKIDLAQIKQSEVEMKGSTSESMADSFVLEM